MKKTVITVIRIIVIVAILGLLTYGGFVGMNRVSGTGDYTIDQYAATDDGGLLTVTKAGTTEHLTCTSSARPISSPLWPHSRTARSTCRSPTARSRTAARSKTSRPPADHCAVRLTARLNTPAG